MTHHAVEAQRHTRQGLLAGFTAYAIWGAFPLYFPLLSPATPSEMLAHRVVWSALTCLILLVLLRRWADVLRVAATPRTLALIAVAAMLIALNWGVYVLAVTTSHVVEAALGYYINPLVTVVLGVVVLGERLRPLQWVAIAFGAGAVAILTVDYGAPPWMALTLAFTFGLYGLTKNRLGRGVEALAGLSLETAVLFVPALAFLLVLQAQGVSSLWPDSAQRMSQDHFGTGWVHLLVLSSAGVVTVVPLLLFATSARRLPLSMVGLLQYLTPTLQFIIGVFVGGEPMGPGRWAGFALVWIAVLVMAADSVRTLRRARTAVTTARTRM